MANIAENIMIAVFPEGTSKEAKRNFFNELIEEVEVFSNSHEFDIDSPEINCMEISFGSKWSEPRDLLDRLAVKYNCAIHGVCYEWGGMYVNHYEINN